MGEAYIMNPIHNLLGMLAKDRMKTFEDVQMANKHIRDMKSQYQSETLKLKPQ